MRSTRLAILSVAVGSALLGWATAGVSAVAGDLTQEQGRTAVPAVERPHHDHDRSHRGGHGGV
jgi:hypothetical protein